MNKKLAYAVVISLGLIACSGCAEEPNVVHRATGTFIHWPNNEDDVIHLGNDDDASNAESFCTTEVIIDDDGFGSSPYRLVVDCRGYFKGYWYFSTEAEEVEELGARAPIQWSPSELLYYWRIEGSQRNPIVHWDDAWRERCYKTNRDVTGTLVHLEATETPIDDRFASIVATLRFETPQGCLSGEIEIEINNSE